MAKKQEIWQGGVCEGLVVGSEEAKQRLWEIYSEKVARRTNDIEVDGRSLEEIQEDELDLFDWLMIG